VDNVEHIYLDQLLAGRYALLVEGADRAVDYALSWMSPDGLAPGDANNDGEVTDADYTIWADNHGQSGGPGTGDFNFDGLISDADYTVWADGGGMVAGTTPAPAPLAILAVASALMLRRRR
jgi:hypothetical protein